MLENTVYGALAAEARVMVDAVDGIAAVQGCLTHDALRLWRGYNPDADNHGGATGLDDVCSIGGSADPWSHHQRNLDPNTDRSSPADGALGRRPDAVANREQRDPTPSRRTAMERTLPDHPSVEDLDDALRTYRHLLVTTLAIVVLGFPAVIGLSYLGIWIAPPYGLRIMGWTLTEWGLVFLLAGLLGYLWVTGRKLGRLLDDQTLLSFPIIGILTGLQVIAGHAHARGLEWSGFLGPLRPVRR